MTHPMAMEPPEDGDAVEGLPSADIAAPQLAAIQHRYEEAKAVIIEPRSTALHPATEEIDVDAVKPPVPHEATPPTEAMSTAARFLAEQQITLAPTPHRHTLPSGPRRWWRAVRAALHGAVPLPR